MKRSRAGIVLAAAILLTATHASADDALQKFSRGLCNVLTCYCEILEQSIKVKNAHGSLAGMTYGLGKGIVMTGVRALAGVYEIATFPFPLPAGYKPLLTDPENFLDPKKEKQAPPK